MDSRAASRLGVVAVGLGIAMAAGAGTAAADSATDTGTTDTKVSAATVSDDKTSEDTASEDKVSEDTASEDKVSEDPASEDSASDDSALDDGASDDIQEDSAETEEPSSGESSTRTETSDSAADTDSETDTDSDVGTEADSDTSALDSPVKVTAAESTPPPAPLAPPAAIGWLASTASWVQREVDYFINGGTVLAQPKQIYLNKSDGAVLGSVNAVHHQRDRLTYEIIGQPQDGAVTIDANGVYIYTPSERPTEGASDSFTVAIRNHGFNLKSLLSLANPALNTTVVNAEVEISELTPPGDSNNTTRGFDIINLTQYELKVSKVEGGGFDGPGPAIGSVLSPGESRHFEIILSAFSDNAGIVHYTSGLTPGSDATISMFVPSAFGPSPSITCPVSNCKIVGNQAVLMEAPNTVVEVRADQPDLQSKILDQLCFTGSRATCSFTATKQEELYAEQQTAVNVSNESDNVLPYTEAISTSFTRKESITVSAKASAEVYSIVSLELSAQYGHEWSTTYTYTETFKLQVPPWRVGYVYTEHPIIRYTGDFEIRLGNTTYYLRDVAFDQADPSGVRPSRWVYAEEAIPRGIAL